MRKVLLFWLYIQKKPALRNTKVTELINDGSDWTDLPSEHMLLVILTIGSVFFPFCDFFRRQKFFNWYKMLMSGSKEPIILFKLDLQLESYAEDFLWEDTWVMNKSPVGLWAKICPGLIWFPFLSLFDWSFDFWRRQVWQTPTRSDIRDPVTT